MNFKLTGLLLVIFGIYLYTLFPAMAPYRDSGEMVSVIQTLGVAHPPGYPLYIITGKTFNLLMPFGNSAYKANVLSAFASILTLLFIYLSFRKQFSGNYVLGPVLLLAFSYLQWYLSVVSEMYTLNTFFAALICYIYFKWLENKNARLMYLFSFMDLRDVVR